MISYDKTIEIKRVLRCYRENPRSILRNQLLNLLESLRVTSPKTGKLIAVSTYTMYEWRCMLKELDKDSMASLLNHFLEDEELEAQPQLGFFRA